MAVRVPSFMTSSVARRCKQRVGAHDGLRVLRESRGAVGMLGGGGTVPSAEAAANTSPADGAALSGAAVKAQAPTAAQAAPSQALSPDHAPVLAQAPPLAAAKAARPAAGAAPSASLNSLGYQVASPNAIKQVTMPAKAKNPVAAVLGKMSLRERVLIAALLAVVIIGLVVYFLLLPAVVGINSLNSEIADLQAQKASIQARLEQTDDNFTDIGVAEADLAGYQAYFYGRMQPEDVDRLVTGLLLDAGFTPTQLDIGQTATEILAAYQPATLAPAGKGIAKDSATASGSAAASQSAQAAATADAASSAGSYSSTAASSASASAPASSSTSSSAQAASSGAASEVYVCTVNIRAEGDEEAFYRFLEAVRDKVPLEIVSYSWSSTQQGLSSYSQSASAPAPSLTMQVKIYTLAKQAG
jgi:cell division protein FtsL